jgi:hypothetical protein
LKAISSDTANNWKQNRKEEKEGQKERKAERKKEEGRKEGRESHIIFSYKASLTSRSRESSVDMLFIKF